MTQFCREVIRQQRPGAVRPLCNGKAAWRARGGVGIVATAPKRRVRVYCSLAGCAVCGAIENRLVTTASPLIYNRPGAARIVRCCDCGQLYQDPRPTRETIGLCYPDNYGPHVEFEAAPAVRPQVDIPAPSPWYLSSLVRGVPVANDVVNYAVAIAGCSRPEMAAQKHNDIHRLIRYGASPRASQYLILGAKARALLLGRFHVDFDDVKAVATPVLRHRLVLNFHARAEGVDADEIIRRILSVVKTP